MRELQFLMTGELKYYEVPRLRGKDMFMIFLNTYKAFRVYRKGSAFAFKYIDSIPLEKRALEFKEMYLLARKITSWSQIFLNVLSKEALCLERSVVVCSVLRSLGIPAQVVIGRRASAHSSERFDFHAWVELNRIPVNDTKENPTVFMEILRIPQGEEEDD